MSLAARRPFTAADRAPRHLVRVSAGEASFALDLAGTRGLVGGDSLLPAEGAPAGAVGWLPRAAGRLPVYPLAAGLGLAAGSVSGDRDGAIVLVDGALGPWGLRVDRVSRLPAEAGVVAPLPRRLEGVAGGRFGGVLTGGGRDGPLLLLELDRLGPGAVDVAPREPADERDEADSTPVAPVFPPEAGGGPGRPGRALWFRVPGVEQAAFAVSFTQVLAVTGTLPAVRVPGAPAELVGLAVWRDEAVPLVDLRRCLSVAGGVPDLAAPHRLLIVRGRRPEPLAFPVAPDLRQLALPRPGRRRVAVPGLDPGLLRGAFDLELGPVVVPDLDRLLPAM